MSAFLAMGGYAAYVWPAFGFALVALLALLAQSWYAARSREVELAELRSVVRSGRSQPRRARNPAQRPAKAATPPENA